MSFESTYRNVCRTCLLEDSTMKSVFSLDDFAEQTMLCDVLMACASVQVAKGDGLPEQVCLNCVQEMNRALLFRRLCEKSDATLRQYLLDSAVPFPVKPESKFGTEQNVCAQQDLAISITDDSARVELEATMELEKTNLINLEHMDSGNANADYLYEPNDELDCSEVSDDLKEKHNEKAVENDRKKKKNYQCKLCEEVCLGLGSYRRHMATVHSQIFQCEVCGKEFKSETMLIRHRISHDELEELKLENGLSKPKRIKNKTGIIKKRNLPRTCTICNKTFRFHSNLERHKLIHTGEKPFLCNVCGKGFAQLSYLKIHSFIHTGEKPYKCQMCDRSFAAPGTLMTHIRTHTGERPHICKICGKDFPQSGYLSAHIRTHTGEKPVECKVCHRRFNQSGRLIIHMRIHSGEKPYACKECGRSFAVKGTLKKHIRTHTGERPYICSTCGQAFAQSGTLVTHMKVHRPK